ncbi:splicing factor U2AF-associated protein 2 [Immersiella caudata]|uniref:Splicing factor U2AF-associated protein 2 n=1 Tax=Immersiella caudata TaxID=314043 RepID=A0AA39XDI3_9PEZI|nr:splicing factor U2AF-associated protein 2 [Immersiella caudata]
MSGEAEYWTFPTNPDEFDQDERISFSRLDNKHIAVQDDGTEYEFDTDLKRWIPMIDETLIQEQQKGYFASGADNDDSSSQKGRKRNRSDEREDSNGNSNGRSAKQARRAAKGPPQPKQNTAVYVTGLPPDATVDEVAELFSRKCGVIAEEIDSGRPRIKLYTDAEGNFKGDALIVFFKPQSVEMAIMLLDDTDFRFTPSGLTTSKMRVQAADSSYKKTNYTAPAGEGGAAGAPSGSNDRGGGNDKPSHKQREQEKQKIIKKTQKLDAKLADWDDDEPSELPTAPPKNSKWEKVVILRHMFTLEELEEDPAALLDIKEDIREECAKLGPVTNVVLFDQEEEGIVSVRFQTAEAAEACLNLMHGRSFDGRTVEAFYATGKEKFKKSKKGDEEGAGHNSDSE